MQKCKHKKKSTKYKHEMIFKQSQAKYNFYICKIKKFDILSSKN